MKTYLSNSKTSIYLGNNLASILLTQGIDQDWADAGLPPIARWVNVYGDTVEGDSYDVHVVAFESSPNGDISSVEFYLDDVLIDTVTSRTDLTGSQVGDTIQTYKTTLDTSGWAAGAGKVVTAVVNSSYGTSLSLSGDRTDVILPHPRAAYDLGGTSETVPSWSISNRRTGIHSLKLYKAQTPTFTTIANLSTAINSLTGSTVPAPVFVLTDTSGDPGQYWKTNLSFGVKTALADSHVTIRGQAADRGTTLTGTSSVLTDDVIEASDFNLKLENITFDKTARVGSATSVFFKNCESNRGLVPWQATLHNDPPGIEDTDWERGIGTFSDYFYQLVDDKKLLIARSNDVPEELTPYTSLVKFGQNCSYHSCKLTHYESAYKRGDACWDCESEFAWRDTYANIGSVLGCAAWEMPFGYDATTAQQYHNDILQSASNLVNVIFYSMRSYKRSSAGGDAFDDLFGNQSQFFSFRDLNGRDTTWTGLVMKDLLFLGSEAGSQAQFNLGAKNCLMENLTILQEKDALGDPGKGLNWALTDDSIYSGSIFKKYRWGHVASSTIPAKTGATVPQYAQADANYIPQLEEFVTFRNVVLAVPEFSVPYTDDGNGNGLRDESYTFAGETKTWAAWHDDDRLLKVYQDKIGQTFSYTDCYFVGGFSGANATRKPTPDFPIGISSSVPPTTTAGAPARLGGPTRNSTWFSDYVGLT
jgi:hypothetical protein